MIRRPTWLRLGLMLLVAASAAIPSSASAVGAYRADLWTGCDGGFNSGGFDTAGRTYVPCGNPTTIGVYAPSGALLQSIPLDRFVTDVEPVGDGSLLYLGGYAAPQRLVRGATGSYSVDATWHPARYRMWGSTYAAGGLFVDSDAAGNVYYADGYWAANGTHTVVEYDSAGGFVTRFGQYVKLSWALGDNYWALGGLAVSPDGRRVLTTEAGNNRLQIWTRGEDDTTFTATGSLGATAANNADRGGYCDYVGWLGKFAAPYDVSLDAAGNVYVINTTCKQMLRFTPDLGTLSANVDVRMSSGADIRPHGFAVGADGTVFVGQNQRVLIPPGSDVSVTQVPQRVAGPATGDQGTVTAPSASQPAQNTALPSAGSAAARFTASLALRRPFARTTRTRQLVYAKLGCSTTCRASVTVRAAGRVLGTFRIPAWSSNGKNIVLSLPRRSRGTQLTFALSATATNTGATYRATRSYRVLA